MSDKLKLKPHNEGGKPTKPNDKPIKSLLSADFTPTHFRLILDSLERGERGGDEEQVRANKHFVQMMITRNRVNHLVRLLSKEKVDVDFVNHMYVKADEYMDLTSDERDDEDLFKGVYDVISQRMNERNELPAPKDVKARGTEVKARGTEVKKIKKGETEVYDVVDDVVDDAVHAGEEDGHTCIHDTVASKVNGSLDNIIKDVEEALAKVKGDVEREEMWGSCLNNLQRVRVREFKFIPNKRKREESDDDDDDAIC